jgi:enoyl-CoA hydratase/carnithine racemase
MAGNQDILFQVEDRVATIALNRPDKHNALTYAMMEEIGALFGEIRERDDISVVIVKGNGPSFAAGHDLTDWRPEAPYAVREKFASEQRRVLEHGTRWRAMMWDLPQPIIGQVQGYCLTSGLELAMNCDLIYAATDAQFAMRSIGGSGRYYHLWPWTVGVRRSKELMFTGRYVSGDEAARIGMVNGAVPVDDLDAHVLNLARQISKVPLAWLALDKQACNKALDLMGAREGQEYAAIMHAASHLTEESVAMDEKLKSSAWRDAVRERDERYAQPLRSDV